MKQLIADNQQYVQTIVNQFNDGLLNSGKALEWLQNAEDFILRNNGGSDYDALCSQVVKAKVLLMGEE